MKIKFLSIAFLIFNSFIFAQGPTDSLFSTISGDTVNIWNTGVFENCGCLFTMDVSVSNDTIYVTETDTSSIWAFCLCYFDLRVSITGLQTGGYQVEVYRKFFLFPDTTIYVGSFSFFYGGTSAAFSMNSYQSGCYNALPVEEQQETPSEFNLQQNYPNPFNPVTTIKYSIPGRVNGQWSMGQGRRLNVKLVVYDLLGRKVATLVNERQQPGNYEVEFNAVKLSSGVYFYKLQSGDYIQTRKMILLK